MVCGGRAPGAVPLSVSENDAPATLFTTGSSAFDNVVTSRNATSAAARSLATGSGTQRAPNRPMRRVTQRSERAPVRTARLSANAISSTSA